MSSDQPKFKTDLGESFYADGVALMFKQDRFVLDFRRTMPRVDQWGQNAQQTVKAEHQPVFLNPQAAKALLNILEENISKYEEQFGEIETPDQPEELDTERDEMEEHGYIG
ncbi:MAG: DUF3467 domain-containing protein [Candidatus Nanohaloarchaea archaeon]|nr:DUF3467 domain-containing protein [Candidatus Nanohaloarchaea archaeon]